ncbi:WbuC family cupin fold metalloprotein [uncultured Draconibacterium sp.]|uniref:WbuC family cupin fold metalloprotein n=1 Tax=uncultured Draconibacterium sp. TaxID=1573823 RepID=UPI0025F49F70|nr:WbuC family cupin fold metalloprotein [uncultured Draconibacterium sp.]
MIKKINKAILEQISKEAGESGRLRKNYNYHPDFNDPINRMLNAVEPGSYVQPHKHENPDKREVFLLLEGKLLVVFFTNEGVISDHLILDKKQHFGVEIPPATWHTIISLESGTVVYEIKDGPYLPADDKNFAAWAPKEGETGCTVYIAGILDQLNIQL